MRRHAAERHATQPTLYAHPFSSYGQKVLIALYKNATQFTYRLSAGAGQFIQRVSARHSAVAIVAAVEA